MCICLTVHWWLMGLPWAMLFLGICPYTTCYLVGRWIPLDPEMIPSPHMPFPTNVLGSKDKSEAYSEALFCKTLIKCVSYVEKWIIGFWLAALFLQSLNQVCLINSESQTKVICMGEVYDYNQTNHFFSNMILEIMEEISFKSLLDSFPSLTV